MRTPGGVFYRLRTGKQRAGTGHPYSAWFYAVSAYKGNIMRTIVDSNARQAENIIQRAAELISLTRLDEIMDDLSGDSRREIYSIMLNRAKAILRDELPEAANQ